MPFVVSRQSRTSLIEQVADGLRSAVVSGHYRAGDTLPNLQEMATALGVSEIVTRRAVQRLTRESLLNPRRGTGIAVCDTALKTWRGHVLYVHWSGPGMYYHGVLSGALTECLHQANILVSAVHVSGPDREDDFLKVRAELGHAVSLAIIGGSAERLDDILAERGIPFIQLDSIESEVSPRAAQALPVRHPAVLPAFRDHCLECGVRTVLQVSSSTVPALDAGPVLAAAGISVQNLHAKPVSVPNDPASVEQGALQALQRWLAARKRLPDLLWFTDDFTARGALLAMTVRGIRIPEDVQVITWANKGLGPVYIKPLTRVEMDPKAHGEAVARCVLDRINGRPATGGPTELTPQFIVGATTRKRKDGA